MSNRGVPELAQTVVVSAPQDTAPEPVFNCPNCTLWLPPGTLACPECHTIVYARHLDAIARSAASLESEQKWMEARAAWGTALLWLPEGTKQAEQVQMRIDRIDALGRAKEENKAKWTKRLGPLAPAFYFLLKAKTLILALFKFKFLLSFVAFFGIYWAIFGWKFGLGLTLSILLHESGHYVAAKRRGLKVDLPVFIPGMGAYVRWYSQGMSLEELASISLAGPTAGLLVAAGCYGVYRITGIEVFGALAHAGAWLNLFNLVPVMGLDGAQAALALDRTQRALLLGDVPGVVLLPARGGVSVRRGGAGVAGIQRTVSGEAEQQDDGELHAAAVSAGNSDVGRAGYRAVGLAGGRDKGMPIQGIPSSPEMTVASAIEVGSSGPQGGRNPGTGWCLR